MLRLFLILPFLLLANPLIQADPVLNLPNSTGAPDSVVIDDAWRLWLDPNAQWQYDTLYLPGEFDLSKLPENAPTGGWNVLSDQAGIPVTLPGTVEEHYWGTPPLKVADSNNPGKIVSLGSTYAGVAWWYRTFTPPALQPGQRLVFTFPGAHLRSEVYVNGHLVGYNAVTEIPFTADATDVLRPGKPNQIAVRITSPAGGSLSWGDSNFQKWGHYDLPISKGFNGLSGGVTMAVHGPVFVDDLYVANNPDPHQVTLNVELSSNGRSYQGPVALSISRDGQSVWTGKVDANVPSGSKTTVSKQVSVPTAELWDLGHPNLYRAQAEIAGIEHSARLTDFGFRWFNAEELGTNAHLELNARRIFVKSAISWGFWAPNGMFPDAEAVQREINSVHSLGLNCVQTHRHFPKAAVLDGFDRAGLLRYCEAGGGGDSWAPDPGETTKNSNAFPNGVVDTTGQGFVPSTFANRYEIAKVEAMVRAYRSHPSVIMWSMQNELGDELRPGYFYLLRKVQQLDPSRIAVLKSGFNPKGEIMVRPYVSDLFYGEPKTGHDSGWHDIHNEDAAGVYQDSLYNNPTDFKTYTSDTTGIAMWGELGTAASPDDDQLIVNWYKQKNIPGYDRAASEARLAAYDAFLNKYGFHSAFPTAESLFRAAGAKHYFAAAHIAENARIADANDFIALTGWESTTVDNNSGIVDAVRNLKGDPAPLRQALAPEVLVIHARHYVVAKGGQAVADAFIANEVNRHGSFKLRFTAAMDSDRAHPFYDVTFPVTVTGGKVFGELLKDNIAFTTPTAGLATMTVYLSGDDGAVLQRTEPLSIVDPNPAPLTGTIACADIDGSLIPAIQRRFGITAVPFNSTTGNVNTIALNARGSRISTLNTSDVQRCENVTNTEDPGLYAEEAVAKAGDIDWYEGLASGDAKVELYFAESYFDKPNQRVFDIAFNEKVVLKHLDIFTEAGGKDRALVKTFTVACPAGKLSISIPKAEKDQAEIAAIRITDAAGKMIREVFRQRDYQSPNGDAWAAVNPQSFPWSKYLPGALERVKSGARLLIVGNDWQDVEQAARYLDKEKIIIYSGLSGYDDIPWIGHWYFGRKHWLLAGLPSDCVLDWQYQAAAAGNGMMLDAPGMEGVVGYGKNPGPGLGFGAVVIPVGQGQIVLMGIGGLYSAFADNNPKGFAPLTATRIIYNALHH